MVPQEPGILYDGSNATTHSESPVLPRNASQFPPPEAAQPADDQLTEAPTDSRNSPGKKLNLCRICGHRFKRPQDCARHLSDVHQPKRRCPFEPCKYNWKRSDKIKAHITKVHGSDLCPLVAKGVCALRGKDVIEFVDAYDFERPDNTYVLLPLPLLASEAPSGECEQYLRCVFLRLDNKGIIWLTSISDYCGCQVETIDLFSSEGMVEQMVEEATTWPEDM